MLEFSKIYIYIIYNYIEVSLELGGSGKNMEFVIYTFLSVENYMYIYRSRSSYSLYYIIIYSIYRFCRLFLKQSAFFVRIFFESSMILLSPCNINIYKLIY